MKAVLDVKFCVIFLEIIVLGGIFFTKFDNIAASSDNATSYNDQVNFVNGFVGASMGMVAVQLLLSLLAFPPNKKLLPWGLVLQIVGLFGYCCFILMKMQYRTVSFIWGVFCLIPFLIDVVSVISQAYINKKYSKLDYN